jgi:hypothetical protein
MKLQTWWMDAVSALFGASALAAAGHLLMLGHDDIIPPAPPEPMAPQFVAVSLTASTGIPSPKSPSEPKVPQHFNVALFLAKLKTSTTPAPSPPAKPPVRPSEPRALVHVSLQGMGDGVPQDDSSFRPKLDQASHANSASEIATQQDQPATHHDTIRPDVPRSLEPTHIAARPDGNSREAQSFNNQRLARIESFRPMKLTLVAIAPITHQESILDSHILVAAVPAPRLVHPRRTSHGAPRFSVAMEQTSLTETKSRAVDFFADLSGMQTVQNLDTLFPAFSHYQPARGLLLAPPPDLIEDGSPQAAQALSRTAAVTAGHSPMPLSRVWSESTFAAPAHSEHRILTSDVEVSADLEVTPINTEAQSGFDNSLDFDRAAASVMIRLVAPPMLNIPQNASIDVPVSAQTPPVTNLKTLPNVLEIVPDAPVN